jgi:hypothetical protein
MSRKRIIGRVAAIGGLAATVALLTGFPAAQADELADLRANQELLQRRIDQLAASQTAQAPGEPRVRAPGLSPLGTQATPGAALIGGSFPRSFLIPGTDTSIRVGGQATEVLDYYLQNGPANGTQSTTVGNNGNVLTQALDIHGQTVPGLPTVGNLVPVNVQHSRGNGVFLQSPRESRMNVETRTPTAWGEARTFIEFDWAGCNNFSCNNLLGISDNLTPRLRFAYGTLGGLLAGQANSNASDPDANPETLDFGGDVGQAGRVRVPQVRYTIAGPWGSAWSASIEAPETQLMTPGGAVFSDTNLTQNPVSMTVGSANTNGCVANGVIQPAAAAPTAGFTNTSTCALGTNPTKSPAPDLTFASYWAQPWGHVDFRFILRDQQFNDGRFLDQKFLGYGGGISGDVKPGWFGWAKDDFQWQFTAGTAIGTYLNSSSNVALATNFLSFPATAAAAGNILVQPVPSFGVSAGYQHWWLPNLRSNLTFGYTIQQISGALIGPLAAANTNREVVTSHVNLIWSPVAFIDAGIEYMWGQRKTLAGIYGKQQVLISKFAFKF